jgi:Zn-dependent M16 (insulinase) family peptidase
MVSVGCLTVGNKGNVENNLKVLNEYLDEYAKLPVLNTIKPMENRFDLNLLPKQRRVFVPGPTDAKSEDEQLYRASLTFYACDNTVDSCYLI